MGSFIDLKRMKTSGISYGCPDDLLVSFLYKQLPEDFNTRTREEEFLHTYKNTTPQSYMHCMGKSTCYHNWCAPDPNPTEHCWNESEH